jgi:DNA-directed RNA polymerase subunit H (RpoH/RPB5)
MITPDLLNRSRCIVTEMLKERGYDVSSISSFKPVVEEIVATPFENIVLEKSDEKILVHYILTPIVSLPKFLPSIVEKLIKKEINKKEFTLTLIISDEPNTKIHSIVQFLMNKYNIYIQTIPVSRLIFNIAKHKLVPKHSRITKNDFEKNYKDFLDSYHIDTIDKLPIILSTDPVALFIGLKPKEICKIERFSETSATNFVYRQCKLPE